MIYLSNYIYFLYVACKEGFIKPYTKTALYRGGIIKDSEIEEIQEKILLAIAFVETKIKSRLTELSK